MNAFVVVPLTIGLLSVLQNTLNRQMATRWGLADVMLLNILVMLLCSLFLSFLAHHKTAASWLPQIFVAKGQIQNQLSIVNFLPGLFGLAVILGLPYAMTHLSVAQVFVVFMGMQLLTSIGWDFFVDQVRITPLKGLGALLTFFGMILVNWKT
ncbi:MAG: DMT family transporter [Myxococcota bacterium]